MLCVSCQLLEEIVGFSLHDFTGDEFKKMSSETSSFAYWDLVLLWPWLQLIHRKHTHIYAQTTKSFG